MNNRLKSGQRRFSVSPHSSKVYCCSGLALKKNRKFGDFFGRGERGEWRGERGEGRGERGEGRGERGMIQIKFSKQKSFLISFFLL